jgi:hypothetical protein
VPLEFALRPRFRLEEERVAPRRRRELSPLVLPVAAYWLGTAALTYKLVYAAPGENAREPGAVTTTEPAPEPRSTAPDSVAEQPMAEPPVAEQPALSAQVRSSLPSLDNKAPEQAPEPAPTRLEPVPAPLQPTPPRVATPSSSPREPLSPRRTAVATELPFVPPGQSSVQPRSGPAPEPHQWLFDALPAATSRVPSASSAPRNPRNDSDDSGGALPSCEGVAAGANQEIDLRSKKTQAPDLSRDALAGVLENGAYLTACGVPDRTTLDICVAVQEGKVKGVTVVTRPTDAALATCVRRAVARLRFPYGPRLDITRTRFDAAR